MKSMKLYSHKHANVHQHTPTQNMHTFIHPYTYTYIHLDTQIHKIKPIIHSAAQPWGRRRSTSVVPTDPALLAIMLPQKRVLQVTGDAADGHGHDACFVFKVCDLPAQH